MAVISVLRKDGTNITKVRNGLLKKISAYGVDYHFAKDSEMESNKCYNAVNEPIRDMQIKGNSVQSNLPSEYQEYTSITDTNGVVYTRNGNIYPAKRNSDGVFGLYNTNINIFQTEV